MTFVAISGIACHKFAFADQVSWNSPEIVAVALISGRGPTPPEKDFWAALDIKLVPGWLTYWKSPGPYGFAPNFDWSKSRNLAEAEMLWPAPKREVLPGQDADTAIYTGHVTLPVRLRPTNAGQPMDIHLEMDFGVCSDVCVPEHAVLTRLIKPEQTGDDDGEKVIGMAKLNLPLSNGSNGLQVGEAKLQDPAKLTIHVLTSDIPSTDIFVEGEFANCLRRPTVNPERGFGAAFTFDFLCHRAPESLTVVAIKGPMSISAFVPVSRAD